MAEESEFDSQKEHETLFYNVQTYSISTQRAFPGDKAARA
jgi:hypothetical protein